MSYDPCQATGAQCKRGYCKTRFQQTFLDKDSVSVDPDESPADHGQVRDGSGIQKGMGLVGYMKSDNKEDICF